MKEVFPIVPAPGVTIWIIAGLALLIALLLGLFIWIGWATQCTAFEVTGDKLSLHGDIYGRDIPRADIAADKGRILDLKVDREHRPILRTNGCGLPGYASGWFRLANGEKALLFVTTGDAVVYLPTTKGYSLLLSPKDPHRLLQALQAGR
jgi:hypothetical protein